MKINAEKFDSYKWLLILFCLVLMIFTFFIQQKRARIKEVSKIPFYNTQLSDVPDGTYYGKCYSSFMNVVVQVTVQNETLKNIVIMESKGIFPQEGDMIINKMISNNKIIITPDKGLELKSIVLFSAVDNALHFQKTSLDSEE